MYVFEENECMLKREIIFISWRSSRDLKREEESSLSRDWILDQGASIVGISKRSQGSKSRGCSSSLTTIGKETVLLVLGTET